jgi:hypothetical protein
MHIKLNTKNNNMHNFLLHVQCSIYERLFKAFLKFLLEKNALSGIEGWEGIVEQPNESKPAMIYLELD